MIKDKEHDANPDRAQQNARGSEIPAVEGNAGSGIPTGEVGPAVAHLLYRLMRDHGIQPDELRDHVAQCRNEEACYSNAALGIVAVQAVQDLLPAPVAAKRLGAWDGPFTAGKCSSQDGETCGAAVFDATGQPFTFVDRDLCVGGQPGAVARATRIAEALNRDQERFERGMVKVSDQLVVGDAWQIHRPSERERINGQPEFVVVVTGDCWHDVERNLADARTKCGFTAPQED